MYSLGVIFFEMCYNPLQTGMERIKVLTELRSYDILFPSDFDQALLMQHTQILQMLLDHDPSRRPNSRGLLQSDLLPPPLVEEAELREMVRHTLANDKSKAYHHLVDSCIGQSMSLSQDISFDMELSRVSTQKAMKKTLIGQEYVRRVAEQVFHRHGALCIQMSHLLPKGKQNVYDRDGSLVQVMTRSGAVVSLPYDLRVSCHLPLHSTIDRLSLSL
jgi:translation initiation factor 2-alpha kinase 4